MNDEGSLEPYCVVGCQVHKTGFWFSSIALKPHDSPFEWGKRGKRGVKKTTKTGLCCRPCGFINSCTFCPKILSFTHETVTYSFHTVELSSTRMKR